MRRLLRTNGRHGKMLLPAGVLCALLAVGGCQSGGSGQAGGSGSAGTSLSAAEMTADLARNAKSITEYPAVPPLDGGVAALKGKSVWYIPIGSSIPIANAVGSAMDSALATAGVEMHVCDGRLLPDTISACMSQAVAQHADAVVTGFIDYSLVPTAFDGLVSNNIKVLVAGEAPSGGRTSSPQLAFYDATPSFVHAEHLALESVVSGSAGKAKILYIGITNSSLTRNIAKDAKDYLARQCAGCTVNSVDYATAEIAKLPSRVSAALLQYPDTDHVVVELDSGANATIQGIQAAGFSDKVQLVSVSGNLDALQRVKAGDQPIDVGLSPVHIGWSYADGVLRMLAGKPVAAVSTPPRVFTKDNINTLTLTDQAYATNVWYGTDAYQDTFHRAWGLS